MNANIETSKRRNVETSKRKTESQKVKTSKLDVEPQVESRTSNSFSREVHPSVGAGRGRLNPVAYALALVAVLAVGLLATGCQRQERTATTQPSETGVVRVVDRGPIKLTVQVDKSVITIAQKMKLQIEVLADEGIKVELPALGDKLSEFTIRDYREWPSEPAGLGRQRWRQEYTLDVLLSGEYTIPAATVHYTLPAEASTQPGDTANQPSELASEPIAIKVASLQEGDIDPTQFEDIAGPVELPQRADLRWAAMLALLIATGGLLGGAFFAWRLLRRKRLATARKISPLEWALACLDRLTAADLIEPHTAQDYYFQLSAIVRHYIERQFQIMAPEYTTEEFLEAMREHPVFTDSHRQLLREFLRTADLVKFALHEPGREEMQQALAAAREFIEQSAASASRSEASTPATVAGGAA